MAATVQGLAAHLRLPEDNAEDLALYLGAARSKLRGAGVREFRNNAYYDLAVYSVAAMLYDWRGIDLTELPHVHSQIQRMVNSFVLELRYAGDEAEDGT